MTQPDLFSQPKEPRFTVHRRENLPENEAHLEANRTRFEGQCKVVYDLLVSGEVLTCADENKYGIGDLRARIRDLIANGVDVQKDWVIGADGKTPRFKKYYLNKNFTNQ